MESVRAATTLCPTGARRIHDNAGNIPKLWNSCNVLRNDGITYQDYVTELTYSLFLKMMNETAELSSIELLTDILAIN